VSSLIAACGSGGGQLSVTLTDASGCSQCRYKTGDTAMFVVTVANRGPSDAPGIQVRVDMPSTFHYKSSVITQQSFGDARTQPNDAQVGVSDPVWGLWHLAAPSPNQDPDHVYARVQIQFTVAVSGPPNKYGLVARAQGDNTSGSVDSRPLTLELTPAAQLSITATVQPGTVAAGQTATYKVTITNSGDGSAADVQVLITLPPVLQFQQSVTPFAGNASRNSPIDPTKGSEEVFYAGFTIPPGSNVGPGFVSIVFKAQVAAQPAGGAYPLNVQVNDGGGDVVSLINTAPLNVTAPPRPSATPTSAATASPTPM